MGVVAALGGQTAINLAKPLHAAGRARSSAQMCDAIERAENRDGFEKLLDALQHPPADRPGGDPH